MVSTKRSKKPGITSLLIGDRLRVTISASPPLNGEICVGETIAFTCHVLNSDHHQQYQYQWSIDEEIPTIGDHTYTIQVPSQSVFNVTCGVYARLNDTNNTTYGANTITVQPSGKPRHYSNTR